jgi:glycosyltransferase involved in cell wall biosynthesis
MDFPLIREVVLKNPDKSFVFAGPMSLEFIPEWFLQTPNVLLTGRFDYDQLPAVLKGFDVTMIPFKKDDVSSTIFPLKLFEYLGAGKPVIATDFNPDLEEFTKGTVSYCKNADEFSEALQKALNSNSEEDIQRRLKVAGENTWQKRIGELSELLSQNVRK